MEPIFVPQWYFDAAYAEVLRTQTLLNGQVGSLLVCWDCQAFTSGFSHWLACGTPEQLKSRPRCGLCYLICQFVRSSPKLDPANAVLIMRMYGGFVRISQSLMGMGNGMNMSSLDLLQTLHCRPLAKRTLEVPVVFLDFDGISHMIKGCQEAHQHPPLSDSTRRSTHVDLILVDVVDYQLVRRTSKDRFLALSYVRGSREALTTTMKNISSLEHPGALSQHGHEIPRLVQDAMEFVRRIGERYMWVDSLCIEHDNLSQKNDRISQMDIIYQQAVATIIALSAPDATASVFGVPPGTLPEEMMGMNGSTKPQPSFSEMFKNSKYETRGWTFQERLLSERCLFMTTQGVFFKCPSLCHNFGKEMSVGKSVGASPEVSWLLSAGTLKWSDHFMRYATLVKEYSKRSLTYPSDAINAFSGISQLLQHRLGGETACGLPRGAIDAALLWCPAEPLVRNLRFPTWSWAGWTGRVTYFDTMVSHRFSGASALEGGIENLKFLKDVPKDGSDSQQSSGSGSSLNGTPSKATAAKDMLSFKAHVVPLSSFPTGKHKEKQEIDFQCHPIDCLRLFTAKDSECGTLFASGNTVSAGLKGCNDGDAEYVLLSRMGWEGGGGFLNVMLIRWQGDRAQRIAVGQIAGWAWKRASPQQKDILLV